MSRFVSHGVLLRKLLPSCRNVMFRNITRDRWLQNRNGILTKLYYDVLSEVFGLKMKRLSHVK